VGISFNSSTGIQPPVLQLNLFGRNHNHNHNLTYSTSSSPLNPVREYYSPFSFLSFSILPFAKLVSEQVQVKLERRAPAVTINHRVALDAGETHPLR